MMRELCAVVPHTSDVATPAPAGPLAPYPTRSDLEAAGAQLRADIPQQHLEAVQALVQSIRSADENTLLWQLRSRLALFQLRELLQSIEAERTDLTHIAASQSLFAQFLTQAYGDDAKTRSEQVSRLANWFHWSRDVTVYQRLIESAEAKLATAAASVTASASTTSSLFSGAALALAPTRSRRRSRSGATLTITYFYELSPRLPSLRARFTEQPTQMESQVLNYLSTWPLSQLRSTLKQHFGVMPHLPSCQLMEEGEEMVCQQMPPSPIVADAASPMATELQQQPLMTALADAAVALECRVPQAPSAASTRSNRFAHPSAAAAPPAAQASPSSSAFHSLPAADEEEEAGDAVSDGNRSQQETVLRSHGTGHMTSRTSKSAAKDAAAPAAAAARPSPAKKRKLESSSSAASSRGVVGFDSPPADQTLPSVPCMTEPHALPLEIIKLGVKAWLSRRQLPSEQASHRAALDNALVDLMWDFSENDLTDGERLAIPEFKRARRSAARDVAARRSGSMSGERACNLLLNVLDMLIARQVQSEL
jgi:hypothetical protein